MQQLYLQVNFKYQSVLAGNLTCDTAVTLELTEEIRGRAFGSDSQ